MRLLGYLHNDADGMIVYEYMPNGSLWDALHGRQMGKMLMDWVSRYNVAVGVAQGLAYLHDDCSPPVIHRDVKSKNILLDGNMEARIADFGLARVMLRRNETMSTVAGSYGYIAPGEFSSYFTCILLISAVAPLFWTVILHYKLPQSLV